MLQSVGSYSIKNVGTEAISNVTVTICHQTYTFKNVLPGAVRTKSYSTRGDSHFEVSAQTASGKTISASGGYVTSGMRFKHDIIIDNQSIKIIDVINR